MNTPFRPVNAKISFPKMEEDILRFWKETDAFRKSMEHRKESEHFTFYDGPPFATGLPHYGHILAGTIKDVVPRYQTMKGKYVSRTFGWDCHGVPVEHEMEKQLGFKNREDIEQFGVKNFCESCRGIVQKYTNEWKQTVERMGRWVDFEHSYRTMDTKYMESIIGVFAALWEKGLIYEGKKVVAYSPKLASSLSNFEANLNYKEIDDPAITVKFKVASEENTFLLAWTTTPWTLPSNLALCVHPSITYVKVKKGNTYYICAKEQAHSLFEEEQNIVEEFPGTALVGMPYTPLLPFFANHKNAFRVLGDDFVSDADGTGIVHLAPAYGEDDNRVCQKNDISPVDPIDKNGYFDETIPELSGVYFRKDETVEDSLRDNGNKRVLHMLREQGSIFAEASVRHSYPFCWRTDCALMYRGIPSIFVDVQKIKAQLIEKNRDINWIPHHIKNGRFGKILENAPDWAISRSRYWGAPIPLWKCEKCNHKEVVGSIAEMGEKAKKTSMLFFVRHGEAEHNVNHILSTKIDDGVPLTKTGEEQAREIGEDLAPETIDIIYTSPLLRTRQTAEIIKKSGNIKAKIVVDERIREIEAGDMDKRTIEEWKQQFDRKDRFYDNPHNGESEADVEKRFLDFLNDVAKKHKGKNIIIVTHGALLRLAEKYFKNLRENEIFALTPLLPPGTVKTYSLSQIPRNDRGEIDLHRPYIDAVVFECKQCGGDMHRVPDVLDCWFESGSMPYASKQLDVRKGEPQHFPADFIAEGLDQTRGWFYTLHVLANALFQKPAFKNVIVNGIVLAEDGQKMSKSKKNYPDPHIIFDTYGADAMRFYLMNSQVVRAEDLRFTEAGVSEVVRKVLLPLWNAYSFFVTYANIDRWHPEEKSNATFLQATSSRSKLDRWILAELGHLVRCFEEKMDAYELDAACREIPDFLDKLTNFYIRRNRRRFWKSEADDDKNTAFCTLYVVLKTFCQVLAPICPYITEEIWQNLKTSHDTPSIHHSDYPKSNFVDDTEANALRLEMDSVRTIISLSLSLRAKKKIRVRQPLSLLRIALPKHLSKEMILENKAILLEEVNVKQIEIVCNPKELGEQIATPNARKLGPVFGKDMQHIIREAKAGNFVQHDDGSITVAEKWNIAQEDITIGFIGKEGEDVESEKGIVVALNTTISDTLKKEGVAREIIRHVQELRKEAQYDISDRIIVGISGADEVVAEFGDMIRSEVLATEIMSTLDTPKRKKEVEIEGEVIKLEVGK